MKKVGFMQKNIRLVRDQTMPGTSGKLSSLDSNFAILFCLLIGLSALLGWLPLEILALYLAASSITFIAYAIDKSAAQNNRWRTKESTLHLLSLTGGWLGALLAQKTLRHKSKKEEFQAVYWVTVFANCFMLGWLLTTKSGSTFLNTIIG